MRDQPLFRELEGLEAQVGTHLAAVRRIAGALVVSHHPQGTEAPPSPPPLPPSPIAKLGSANVNRHGSISISTAAVSPPPNALPVSRTMTDEIATTTREVEKLLRSVKEAEAAIQEAMRRSTMNSPSPSPPLPQLAASRLPLPPPRQLSPLRPPPPPGVLLATPPPVSPGVTLSAQARAAAMRRASEVRRAALAVQERDRAHEQCRLIEDDVARGQRVIAAQQRVLEEQERSFRALLCLEDNNGGRVAAPSHRGSGGGQPTPIRFDVLRETTAEAAPPPPRISQPMYPGQSQVAAPTMSSPLPRFSPPSQPRWVAHGGLLPAPPAPRALDSPFPGDGVDVTKSRPGVAIDTFEPTEAQLLGHAIAVECGEEIWLAIEAPALIGAAPAGWCWVTARATGRAGFVPDTFVVHSESAKAHAVRRESAEESAKHERLVTDLKVWQARNAEQMIQLAALSPGRLGRLALPKEGPREWTAQASQSIGV